MDDYKDSLIIYSGDESGSMRGIFIDDKKPEKMPVKKRIPKKPKYQIGDTVVYKSGRKGYHFGFNNGDEFIVRKIKKPILKLISPEEEYGGWLVCLSSLETGEELQVPYPTGWFRKV